MEDEREREVENINASSTQGLVEIMNASSTQGLGHGLVEAPSRCATITVPLGQYTRIIERRKFKLAKYGPNRNCSRGWQYKSRHVHAVTRPRLSTGRFQSGTKKTDRMATLSATRGDEAESA
jgi:hypothetical protein